VFFRRKTVIFHGYCLTFSFVFRTFLSTCFAVGFVDNEGFRELEHFVLPSYQTIILKLQEVRYSFRHCP